MWEREKEQNIKQHKTNEEKKYCTLIHNIAIFYVVLLRVSVCWGKIRKLCEKTIEYIKNMYGNFPTFGIIFSCPASLLISKVYFFFVSIFKYSFFYSCSIIIIYFIFVFSDYLTLYIYIFAWDFHLLHCCVKKLLAYILNYLVSLNVGFNWQNLQLYAE